MVQLYTADSQRVKHFEIISDSPPLNYYLGGKLKKSDAKKKKKKK